MKFRIMLILLVLLTPAITSALGLGKLELQSALNQPFKAKVMLLSATADELDSLKVSLAGQEAFDRAGIQRTFLLTQLRFSIQESEKGPDYIQIRSSESIREPFLNFLLEINWSKGRLFREYTVLLDPPTYTSRINKKKVVVHPKTPVVKTDSSENQIVYDSRPAVEPVSRPEVREPIQTEITPNVYEEPRTINYSGSGEYGPAATGDTLWSVAKAARPDSSVSIQQMMLAILSANPEAFIENNINGLKRGAVLKIPDASEFDSQNQAEILAEVINQHALWDEYKGYVAANVPAQPSSSGTSGQETTEQETAEQETTPADPEDEPVVTDIEETGEAELRLISESDEGTGSDQSTADSPEANVNALNNELAIASESIEALYMENAELKDKLTETEGIIDDLKRLIVLKEDELAAMQEQIMVAAADQVTTEEIEADETGTDETGTETGTEETTEILMEDEVAEEVEEEIIEEIEEESEAEEAVGEGDSEEVVFEDVVLVESDGAAAGLMSFVNQTKDSVMGLVGQAKDYLLYIAGAVGALLLLGFGMLFASRRRSSTKATTEVNVPTADFPDFGDDANETVRADADEDIDSESVTVIPGSEEETILPEDDSFEIPDAGTGSDQTVVALPGEDEAEEDPMEEVNVFLAYEHFDEAESFVRKALEEEPDNLDFHSKLLEVFYAANNKKSYEEAAKVVHDKTNGEGEYWDMATVMWQEISPNRALFEAPVAGEDDEVDAADSAGGGVLNIAADDDGSANDTDELDISVDGTSGEDMLDVTAAADMDALNINEDSQVEDQAEEDNGDLDFTLGIDKAMEAAESEVGDSLDNTMQMESSDVQMLQEAEDVLDVTTAVDTEEDQLDVSIAQVHSDADELDISFDDVSGETEEDVLDISFDGSAGGDEDSLDISVDDDSGETAEDGLDISFDDSPSDSAEDSLDISLDEKSSDEEALDLSLGDSVEDSLDISLDEKSSDEGALDLSLGDSVEDSLDISLDDKNSDEGVLDLSLGDSADEGSDLLDIAGAGNDNDAIGLDIPSTDSSDEGDDLLDVTSAFNYESEGEQEDLLDVTSTTTKAGVHANDLTDQAEGEDGALDIDMGSPDEFSLDLDTGESSGLSLEDSVTDEDNSADDLMLDMDDSVGEDSGGLDFDLDLDDGSNPDETVELNLDPSEEIDGLDIDLENDLDMESTVQMPAANVETLAVADDDEDKTFMVPKSSNVDEQSEDEEMASQLDLAKAYIELGDNENAKTILDEIMAQGSENYRKQAEELLSQIN